MYKAYRFRIYPNEDQETLIVKHIGSCRFVWNHFLDMRNKRYTETGKSMTYKDMALLLPSLKNVNANLLFPKKGKIKFPKNDN